MYAARSATGALRTVPIPVKTVPIPVFTGIGTVFTGLSLVAAVRCAGVAGTGEETVMSQTLPRNVAGVSAKDFAEQEYQ